VRRDFDAVIVGGGPAGGAAALTLARAGRHVLLIEQSPERPTRAGEALAPAARPLLRDLGLLDRLAEEDHLPCYGNQSVWGSDEPHTADFLFNPYGHGWHLDRRRFDAMLRVLAREAGAELRVGRLIDADRSTNGQWLIRTHQRHGGMPGLSCDWLVDASGRRSAIACRHGAVRRRDDTLVALLARFRPPVGSCRDRDSRTFIEAMPDGWWYSALLPSGERMVAFLTDAELVENSYRTSEGFRDRLYDARHLHALLAGHSYQIVGHPKGADAGSSRLDRFAGNGWVAVGDAAIAFDPLSSQGLLCALDTGTSAGHAIDLALEGDIGLVVDFCHRVNAIYAAYRRELALCYAAERRWSDRLFWNRRLSIEQPIPQDHAWPYTP
jgi:flavin-dependent dehydrogenase